MHNQLLGLHHVHKAYGNTDNQRRPKAFLDQFGKADKSRRGIADRKNERAVKTGSLLHTHHGPGDFSLSGFGSNIRVRHKADHLAAETGHIGVHEAGAVEYTGHKVLPLPQHQGKIRAEELKAWLKTYYADANHEHMVFPGMVYISFSTEYGTIYSRAELEAIHGVCREYGLPLFIDGARLGYGLASLQSDLDLPALASLCDVFYIGGTKVGALCGEAVVFPRGNAPAHFMTTVKQHGALLAKGRLLGIQFDTLFTDDLYGKISRHAIDMAEKLKEILHRKGIPFFLESPTNQQFVILSNQEIERLKPLVGFDFWEAYDADHTVVRFATSWATPQENLDKLAALL